MDRIAVTFTEYFSAIGCRGEMHVDIPELVADAAIVLKVAFREAEPLKVLSAKTQVRLLPWWRQGGLNRCRCCCRCC